MSIEIRQRPLSGKERQSLQSSLGGVLLRSIPSMAVRYLLFFLLMLGAGLSLVAIASAAVTQWHPEPGLLLDPGPWLVGLFIAVFWGSIFLVPAYVAARKLRRELWWHRVLGADGRAGVAEVVRIEGARYLVAAGRRTGVFFLFEIGPDRVLLVGSERVGFDRSLFGLPPLDDDHEFDLDSVDESLGPFGSLWWNSAVTPFPNSAFELHRLPCSGHILQVVVAGQALAPEATGRARDLALPNARKYRGGYEQETLMIEMPFVALVAGLQARGS